MAQLAPAWIERHQDARWRSRTAISPRDGARASGTSIIHVPRGCRLGRHTDSAEETIVVVAGTAEVLVDDRRHVVPAGEVALVPEMVPHEVRNAGAEPLRFAAVYAAPDVVTTYEEVVQPDGRRERHTISAS